MTRNEEAIKNIKEHCYFANLIPQEKEALDMVIEALQKEPCEDVVSRQGVAQVLLKYAHSTEGKAFAEFLVSQINDLPPVTPQQNKWIPITSRPMTEEEKEHYKIHPDYMDDCRIFNCKLPDDGQEVLISVCGGVEVDTFVKDGNDGCYFEGRDIDDVDAWIPLPDSYKQEVEG